MNPKIKKTRDELERTKDKIIELQALVPQLERSIIDMENTDIIKAVRSADISIADLPAFIASLKQANTAVPVTNKAKRETSGTYGNYEAVADFSKDNDLLLLNDEEDDTDA